MKPKQRADAKRNLDALLEAAKAVFAESGVDAPVRDIASKAGVGIATVYRHFPQRADLIAAVFRREVDACAAAATTLARGHEPMDALRRWLHRYTNLLATKRGLAKAVSADDPERDGLAAYFQASVEPAVKSLLDAAALDVDAHGLLRAVGALAHDRPMVDLLIDGLRFRAAK